MNTPLCCSKNKSDILLSLELLCSGVIFGLFNNLSTVFNIKILHDRHFDLAAWLSLFFLLFPGIVTSFGYLVFHCIGYKKAGQSPPLSVFIYFFVLLFFYPVLTVAMWVYYDTLYICNLNSKKIYIIFNDLEYFLGLCIL